MTLVFMDTEGFLVVRHAMVEGNVLIIAVFSYWFVSQEHFLEGRK